MPNPDKNPDFQFLLTVRLMQSMPNGPSGTETAIPIIKPSQSRLKSMAAKIAEKNDHLYRNFKSSYKLAAILFILSL